MELFQKFLNTVSQKYKEADKRLGGWLPGGGTASPITRPIQRTYGQVDKKAFGGLLPGGAATPIGAAFQGVKGPQPTPTQRRTAAVLDATAGAIAGTQPVVQNIVRNAPGPVQSAISSGLNTLPFSVNLFGRYFTGLGGEGLRIPQNIENQIRSNLNQFNRDEVIKSTESQTDILKKVLNDVRAGTYLSPLKGQYIPMDPKFINDELAQANSMLNQLRKGNIPYSPYEGRYNSNPFNSTATSIGKALFTPVPGGYQAKETYDFLYAGGDLLQGPVTTPLTPSQEMILPIAEGTLDEMSKNMPAGARAGNSPFTQFGRAIVTKMKPGSFDYVINIPK